VSLAVPLGLTCPVFCVMLYFYEQINDDDDDDDNNNNNDNTIHGQSQYNCDAEIVPTLHSKKIKVRINVS